MKRTAAAEIKTNKSTSASSQNPSTFNDKAANAPHNDTKTCEPYLETADQTTYSGSLKNSIPDGVGIMANPTLGCFYVGQFAEGQYTGLGCLVSTTEPSSDQLFGKWDNNHLINGYGRKLLKQVCETKNVSVIYEGEFTQDEPSGLGKLHIQTSAQKFKIIGEWNNGKIKIVYHNDFASLGNEFGQNLIAAMDGNQNSVSKLTDLFQMAVFFNNNQQINSLDQVKKVMTANGTYSKLSSDTSASIDILVDLQELYEYTLPYFKDSQQQNIWVKVDAIKNLVNEHAVRYAAELKKCAIDSGSRTLASNAPILDVFGSLEHMGSSILLVHKEYVQFFSELNNLACTTYNLLPDKMKNDYCAKVSVGLTALWAQYQEIMGDSILSTTVIHNIESYKYLFSLELEATKIIATSSDRQLLTCFGNLQAILKIILANYKPWQENQTLLDIINNPKQRKAQQIDLTLQSATITMQVWNHLVYAVFSRAEDKDKISQLHKLYRHLISNIANPHLTPPPYDIWREAIINLLKLQANSFIPNNFWLNQLLYLAAIASTDINDLPTVLREYTNFQEPKKEFINFNSTLLNAEFVKERQKIVEIVIALEETIYNRQIPASNHCSYIKILKDFMIEFGTLDFTVYVNKCTLEDVDTANAKFEDSEGGVIAIACDDEVYAKLKPKHYVLDTIIELLTLTANSPKFANIVAEQQAKYGLLDVITKSFKFLSKQPECADLENFFTQYKRPFHGMLKTDLPFATYTQKLKTIHNYFTQTALHNEISIDRALLLYKGIAQNAITEPTANILKNSYIRYEEEYHELLTNVLTKTLDVNDLIANLKLLATVQQIKEPATVDLNERIIESNLGLLKDWNRELRCQLIPAILARLAVLLSLLYSRYIKKIDGRVALTIDKSNQDDIAEESQFLAKPNCIQILGLFRLVCVDNSANIKNHLAEILTGQGKSWVLALLSSAMALTGHDITVVCYDEYLTARDKVAFAGYYSLLGLNSLVNYKTFQDMAEEAMKVGVKVNGLPKLTYGIRDFILKILKEGDKNDVTTVEQDKTTSEAAAKVLLIDEVDVFFSQSYGQIHGICVRYAIEKLLEVQKYIWDIVNKDKGQVNAAELLTKIIKDVTLEDTELAESAFYKKNIADMINAAIKVYAMKNAAKLQKFIINTDGYICYNDEYTQKPSQHIYDGYHNSFAYMALMDNASKPYAHQSFNNYGYLISTCGRISYAEIPKIFPLILGVTGTLKELSGAEQKIVREETKYAIDTWSFFPSFYGARKLKFKTDCNEYFQIIEDEEVWQSKIINTASRLRENGQAVLIFLNNENMLRNFENKVKATFSPLFSLTPMSTNSEKATVIEKRSSEPGAVTLLTKNYGRGTDFKSNSQVNQKGGVAVIQTFPSIDIKEELQVRGRTARQDDPGAFFLFLHAKECKNAGIDVNADASYLEYDNRRKETFTVQHKSKTDVIENTRDKHVRTLTFLHELRSYVTKQPADTTMPSRKEMLDKILKMHSY